MQQTMAQNTLRNLAVWSVPLFLLTGKYSSHKVRMARKYHDGRLQTNPKHREEETQNTGNTTCNTIFFNIVAILCSWVCWFQPTRSVATHIFSRL